MTRAGLVMAAALAVLMMTCSAVARAGVIWTLYETSCTPESGAPCVTPPFPFAVGRLALPTIDSSGSYSYVDGVQSGDTDFAFSFAARTVPPPTGGCASPLADCSWMVNFSSSASGLSFSVEYHFGLLSDLIDIRSGANGWRGMIGSDSTMLGCGQFSTCLVSGLLSLTVPEPSPLLILLAALCGYLGLAFTITRARRRVRGAAANGRT